MTYDIIFLVGFFGALIQLVAYALNLRDKLHHHSMAYLLANVIGCLMTVTYATMTWDVPFLMLEISWGAFALHKLYEIKLKGKKGKRTR
jgi:fluoride ion exporter CrcB/FEX